MLSLVTPWVWLPPAGATVRARATAASAVQRLILPRISVLLPGRACAEPTLRCEGRRAGSSMGGDRITPRATLSTTGGEALRRVAARLSDLGEDDLVERVHEPDLFDAGLAVAGQLLADVEPWVAIRGDLDHEVGRALQPVLGHQVAPLITDDEKVGLRGPALVEPHRIARAAD